MEDQAMAGMDQDEGMEPRFFGTLTDDEARQIGLLRGRRAALVAEVGELELRKLGAMAEVGRVEAMAAGLHREVRERLGVPPGVDVQMLPDGRIVQGRSRG